MLSGRINPITCFYGNSYSISTLRNYCHFDGSIDHASTLHLRELPLWASSAVSPNFGQVFCEKAFFCLMGCGSLTMLVRTRDRACRSGIFSLPTFFVWVCSALGGEGFFSERRAETLSVFWLRATTFRALGSVHQ